MASEGARPRTRLCQKQTPVCSLAHTAVGFSALIGIGQIIPVTLSNVLEQSPLISEEKAK